MAAYFFPSSGHNAQGLPGCSPASFEKPQGMSRKPPPSPTTWHGEGHNLPSLCRDPWLQLWPSDGASLPWGPLPPRPTGFLEGTFLFFERAGEGNFLGAAEGGGSFLNQIWEREGTFFHQRARFLAKRARFLRVFLCPSRVSFPLGPLF